MSVSKSVIVIALCFLFSIDSVFSKVEKCYGCTSLVDVDCVLNPEQDKFVMDCKNLTFRQGIDSMRIFNGRDNEAVDWACAKATVSNDLPGNKTIKQVVRACAPKNACEQKVSSGITLNSCDICTSDLCNSSSVISVGFYSLTICLAMIFVYWK
ncbi:uncharacterized protein LOC100122183 [Nasonia vitripennis]|uniref:Protein sleepless n=1 Tax=Nasonia vitripennis TaxID=7425 RepID=A0A7M7GBH6_NASVI|nr:uncharacterized protein LOC100122183 [Nasonia vitripennis]